jgi:hypothetical protein
MATAIAYHKNDNHSHQVGKYANFLGNYRLFCEQDKIIGNAYLFKVHKISGCTRIFYSITDSIV